MERPMNLKYTRQFGNTEDFVNDTPEINLKAGAQEDDLDEEINLSKSEKEK